MRKNNLIEIEKEILKIKRELQNIGEMRPGSLTLQYQAPKEKRNPFYQLSYTRDMKSRTDYVRPEFVNSLKQQIGNYNHFRKLTKKWVDLAIKYSKIKIAIAVKNK